MTSSLHLNPNWLLLLLTYSPTFFCCYIIIMNLFNLTKKPFTHTRCIWSSDQIGMWSGRTSLHFSPCQSVLCPFGPRIVSQLVGRLAACTWLANHCERFSSMEILLHQSQYSAYRLYLGHPFESTFQSVQAQFSLEPLWHSWTHIVSSFWGSIVPPSFQSDWAGWPHQFHDL